MSGMPLCPTGIIKGAIHHVLKRTCFLARFHKIGGHANGNHVEDMMMNSLNAKQELRLIVDTIQLCDLDNKTILTEECIHNKSPLKVMMDDLLCSKSNYYKKRQDALLEFADRYANKGRDLHVYKKSAELAFCNGLTPKKS